MSDDGRQDGLNVQAEGDGIAVGSINIAGDSSGTISVGHRIGYTSEQVSLLINQITTTFQPKPFDGRCPYKGLDVFEEEDAELFFGRERLVEDLVELVKASRTVFITGPSGSGKSSLVRAGLIHALRQGAIQDLGSERWLYAALRPGRDPFEALAGAFSRLKSPELGDYFLQNVSKPDVLHKCAESALGERRDQRLALFIDQFEEVFTQLNQEKTEVFVELLARAAGLENGRVVLLFAMRSDFISNCTLYPKLNALYNHQNIQIGGMQPKELVSAIAQPALRVGLRIDHDLIAQIIHDMQGEPGALPLMQFALKDLFDAQQARGGLIALTLNDYLQRGGIAKALERHADDSFNRLKAHEQELARSIFSGLIEIGRGTQDTRRTARFDELVPASKKDEEARSVLQKLANARLITTDEKSNQYTITHEKLIDAWPWLKKLVNENRDVIALQNEIAADANEWEEHKRDASYLYTGARLVNANEQLKSNRLVLSGTALEYIWAGQARQRRSRVTLFGTTATVIALLILAVIVFRNQSLLSAQQADAYATLAIQNKEIAGTAQAYAEETQIQAGLALARQLASLARSINPKSSKQMIAMLLATQSMQISSTGEASELLVNDNLAERATMRITLDGTVNSVKFSPDGEYIASGGCNKVDETNTCIEGYARVWARTTGEEKAHVIHDNQMTSMAFSTNGKNIVSGGGTTVLVWESTTGKVIARMNHAGEVYAVAFSPDGKYVASGSSDNTARVWEVDTRKEIARIAYEGPVYTVAFSQDSAHMVSGSHDGTVRVWDISNNTEIMRVTKFYPVISVEINKTVGYLILSTIDGTVSVWNVSENTEVASVAHEQFVSSVAFSPDGSYVVSGSSDGTIRVLDFSTGTEIARWTQDDAVTSIAVSPNGGFIVTGSSDFTARVWDIRPGKEISRMTHNSIVTSVGFSQDGRYVVSGGNDGSLRIWEAPTNKENFRYQIETHDDKRYSPDGKYVVTVSSDDENDDNYLHLWEMATGKETGRTKIAGYLSLAFDQDGKYLLIEDDIEARIWELATGTEVFKLSHLPPTVLEQRRNLTFSPNLKYVVEESCELWNETSQCVEGSSYIWNVTTGKEIAQIPYNASEIFSSVFSHDGKYLFSQLADSTATLWETPTGKEIARLELARSSVPSRFSPDGNYLLTFGFKSDDAYGQLWETATGSQVAEFIRKDGWLANTAFSPEGRYLVSSGCDRTGDNGSCLEGSDRILEVSTGKEISRLITNGITPSLVFSPDGNFVASIEDSSARVWETATGNETAFIVSNRDLDVSFSPDSKYFVSIGCDIYIEGCNSSTIRVWETATGKVITRITRDGSLTSSNFSPDGKNLVSSGCNEITPDSNGCIHGVITVWEVISGRETARILTGDLVYPVTFSSNGNFIISKHSSPEHLWFYRAADLVSDACSRLPRNLTQEEWQQYIGDALSYKSICATLPESEPMLSFEVQNLGSSPASILELFSSEGININIAGLEELDSLPGIGQTTAQRIIDYRQEHGPFVSIEDLINVTGIGPATFEGIMDIITVVSPETKAANTPTPTP